MHPWQFLLLGLAGQTFAQQSCPSVSYSLVYITKTVTVSAGATVTGGASVGTTMGTSTRSSSSASPSSTSSRSSTSLTSSATSVSTTTSPTTKPSTSSTSTTTSKSSSSSPAASPSSNVPIVLNDAAYINTIIRHHNIHRQNHTASALTWNANLAQAAALVAGSCVYAHNTSANANLLGTYGQNIGGGYASNQMGLFITGGLYNGEVNSYTYFGAEPPIDTLHAWGHFSQVVWKGSASVGCATADCSAVGGLANVGGNVPPTFTVCNYGPAGNYIGLFALNVGRSIGLPTVQPSYGCENQANPNVNCV